MHNFFVIVLDGVGIGELPDAANYNDSGSDTLCNIAKHIGGLNLPNLEKLGLEFGKLLLKQRKVRRKKKILRLNTICFSLWVYSD